MMRTLAWIALPILLLSSGRAIGNGTSGPATFARLAAISSQGLTKCPKCKKAVQPTWKFCDKCGTRLLKPATTTGGTTGTGGTSGTTPATVANMHVGHGPMASKSFSIVLESNLGVALTSGAQVARSIALNADGSRVIYGGNSGATTDLYMTPTDKPLADTERITDDTSGAEFDPDFGPLGRRIVYVSESAKGGSTLQFRDLLQGDVRTLYMDPGVLWHPRFSPDGRKIVYVKKESDRSPGDLYMIDLEKDVTTQLTSGNANDEYPTWCPQGCHVAFESDRTGTQHIWSVAVGDKSLKQVSKGSFPHRRPAWSKRGFIVYETSFTLKVMNENGVEGMLGTTVPIAGSLPRISADGKSLAFERRGSLGVEVFIVRFK